MWNNQTLLRSHPSPETFSTSGLMSSRWAVPDIPDPIDDGEAKGNHPLMLMRIFSICVNCNMFFLSICEVKCFSVFLLFLHIIWSICWDMLYHFMQFNIRYIVISLRSCRNHMGFWDVLTHSHTALLAPMSTMLRLPSIGLLVVLGIYSHCAMLHQGNTNTLELGVVDGCQNQPLLWEFFF